MIHKNSPSKTGKIGALCDENLSKDLPSNLDIKVQYSERSPPTGGCARWSARPLRPRRCAVAQLPLAQAVPRRCAGNAGCDDSTMTGVGPTSIVEDR